MDISESSFLKKFDDIILLSEGNKAEGKPALINAELRGSPKLIKYWEKATDIASPELEQLWLDEIRQLQRLKGYPNPENHIAYLDHSGKDSIGFYLVLETNGRIPLSYAKHRWLKSITHQPDNQLQFWKNLIRIIRAIDFLHSQGLLHRNLDQHAILIGDGLNNNNFQLTGFEWSIRIQHFAAASFLHNTVALTETGRSPQSYSFANDWCSLGVLICEFLNIQIVDLSDIGQPINTVAQKTNLSVREITLIRALMGITRIRSSVSNDALNGQLIEEYIEKKILYYLDQAERTPFDIIFSFQPRTPSDSTAGTRNRVGLFAAVQEKQKELCGIVLHESDQQACLDFIEQDLMDAPVLFTYRDEQALLLKGKTLVYLLEPNKASQDANKTWETAFCQAAFREMPEVLKNNQYIRIDPQTLKLWTTNRRSQTLLFRSWQTLIEKLSVDKTKKTEKQQDLVDGFIAYHLTEMAYARTDIYPVTVQRPEADSDDPQYKILKLSSSANDQLEDLNQVLGLEPSARRLKKNLEDEEAEPDWILTSKQNFQDDDESIEMSFIEIQLKNGKEIFVFRTKDSIPDTRATLFLMPVAVEGTVRQLNRRAKALELLDKHPTLIDSLLEPHLQLQDSPEVHQIEQVEDHLEQLKMELDDSKKLAFKNVIHTLPTYLVQGPPGVGKTYLVTAIVNHIFKLEPESRVLLTAQSHSTVQHLYQEVTSTLHQSTEQEFRPLIVKCIRTPQKNGYQETNASLDEQARGFLKKLTESQIFQQSSRYDLKAKIQNSHNLEEKWQRYSLMNHLLRAANLVFTTTNSRYVEDMLTHKAQFDWSIMEETGKVTGIELLSPILLSHRRLMIGDHLQLPPYRAAEMQNILRNPEKLRGAMHAAVDGKKNVTRGDTIGARIEELKKIPVRDTIQLQKLGNNAARTHLLFEMLIKAEEEQVKNVNEFGELLKHRPTASMLTEQYRMHPNIAEIISEVFYDPAKGRALKKLTTAPTKIEYFKVKSPPFYWFETSGLKESAPITWINLPDIMETQHSTASDYPTWHNPEECKAILTLLQHLRAVPDAKPKLAILTAYNQQKISIERQMKQAQLGTFSHLDQFSKPDDRDSFCSTINSFQGAEADIVILSMVRNNIRGTIRSAFGFFLDIHLFNVMLSRARFQLVIVGSFQFLKRWANSQDVQDNTDFSFLCDLVEKLESLEREQKLSFISFAPNSSHSG